MTAALKLVPVWVWLVLAAVGALALQQWRITSIGNDLSSVTVERDTAQAQTESLTATMRLQRELARDAAAIDTKHTQELTDARQANAELAAAVADGTRRLRVKASCPVPRDPSALGVDDGAGPELTADARQDYFALRDQITVTERRLAGLQAYVRMLIERMGGAGK